MTRRSMTKCQEMKYRAAMTTTYRRNAMMMKKIFQACREPGDLQSKPGEDSVVVVMCLRLETLAVEGYEQACPAGP